MKKPLDSFPPCDPAMEIPKQGDNQNVSDDKNQNPEKQVMSPTQELEQELKALEEKKQELIKKREELLTPEQKETKRLEEENAALKKAA